MDAKKQSFTQGEDLAKVNREIIPGEDFSVDEFSILELEDRLELEGRCNSNCSCPAPTAQ